jgi:hypothetical protein
LSGRKIDENLIRADLTDAQRAKLVAKRKAAYEAVQAAGAERLAKLAKLKSVSRPIPPGGPVSRSERSGATRPAPRRSAPI